jgi:hypothetical protein
MLVITHHIVADACVSLITSLMSVSLITSVLKLFNFSSFNSCWEIEAHGIVSGGGAEAYVPMASHSHR